jgi:hypothetical protein
VFTAVGTSDLIFACRLDRKVHTGYDLASLIWKSKEITAAGLQHVSGS